LVSIPALIRRIRREWAGLVPPIGQKTTLELTLALLRAQCGASSRIGLQWMGVLQLVESGNVQFAEVQHWRSGLRE